MQTESKQHTTAETHAPYRFHRDALPRGALDGRAGRTLGHPRAARGLLRQHPLRRVRTQPGYRPQYP
ncbi:hypothetical protein CBM2586_A120053 [Cupriavidus phytorum]|uniref:Uncharacterized protein n=1 Tax=Cupriavidus taiwanensis TaxID=164546 RepID=A0A375C1K3_9BURK|nr:hypothetical protein CBM2586_A120053 [Cupriavidus taiwanensis]